MSRRKELNKDNYSADADIPEGDEQHPVWQAAFGSAFAMNAEHMTGSTDSVVRLYRVATSTADMAYVTYKESIGVHKRTKKQSSNTGFPYPASNGKDFPTFNIGPVSVLHETAAAILIAKDPQEFDDKGREEGDWFPKRCIHHTSEVRSKEECDGNLIVSLMMAEEKGYIHASAQEEIANDDDRIPF